MVLADAVHRRAVGRNNPVGEAVPVPPLGDRPTLPADELVKALVREFRVVDPPVPAEDDGSPAVLVDPRARVALGGGDINAVPLAFALVARRVPAEDVSALLLGTSLEPAAERRGVSQVRGRRGASGAEDTNRLTSKARRPSNAARRA